MKGQHARTKDEIPGEMESLVLGDSTTTTSSSHLRWPPGRGNPMFFG